MQTNERKRGRPENKATYTTPQKTSLQDSHDKFEP